VKVFRGILAVVVGFIVASAVMMCVEFANGQLIYPALGRAAEGLTDRDAVRQVMAAAPVGAFLVVMAGWILGSLAGGFVAAKITTVAPMRHAIITGALLTLGGVANNLMLPPPAWFWIGVGVFLPSAWFGGKAASRA
jgi:hypothetical protein